MKLVPRASASNWAESNGNIEAANTLLTELVNEGTRVFMRCESEATAPLKWYLAREK